MVTNRKVYGKAASMPAGIGIGAGVSLLVTLAGCGVLAFLLQNETIQMETVGYGAMAILLAAAFLGGAVSSGLVKRKRLMVCLVQAVIYFAMLLLINGLAFGGAVAGVGVTALVILAGSGCAILLGIRGGGKRMAGHRKWRTG